MFIMKYIIASIKIRFLILITGYHFRDFTYIEDVNNILYLLLKKKTKKKHDVFNICSSSPQKITNIIKTLNKYFKKPRIKKLPLQKADILKTHGSNKKVKRVLGFSKFTKINDGLEKISIWVKKNSLYFRKVFKKFQYKN